MDDKILIKYLLKETDESESLHVEDWINAHIDHRTHYEQIKKVWDKSEVLAKKSKVDVEKAWIKFKSRRQTANFPKSSPTKPFKSPYLRKFAACVFLMIGAAWMFLFSQPYYGKAYFSEVSMKSNLGTKEEILMDGSKITLNKNTLISYSQILMGKSRIVKINEGEAYFEVEKNMKKPFIVEVGEAKITVLGTSFNVNKKDHTTTVIVDSGVVSINSGSHEMTLTQNQKATIDHQNGSINISNHGDQLFRYYVDKKFIADGIKLYQLIEVLNLAYGRNVEIASDQVGNLTVTTTLEYASLNNNLQILKETLGIKITKHGDKIILE